MKMQVQSNFQRKRFINPIFRLWASRRIVGHLSINGGGLL